MSLKIPRHIRKLGEPKTIDVFVCDKCHDAHTVGNWLEEKMPGTLYTVVGVTMANVYLVFALSCVEKDAPDNGTKDTRAK